MGGLELSVQALLAREAIRDLPLRYCDCVWRDDSAGIAALFAANGQFIAHTAAGETRVSGRSELQAFFARALDIKPRPFIHNHVIERVADGFGYGRCYLDLRSARHDMNWIGAGYYDDEYVNTADGWKFQSRRFYALRMDELPDALSESH